MRDELYINDRLVDLPENPNIGLDYEQGDIGDPGSRKANKSTSITVPFTAVNLDIFGFCNIPESGSSIPYNNLPCKYKKYGIEVIKKGTVVIDEITQEGFSINMYWGAFDFFKSIKEAKISALDFDSMEEDWTSGNIIARIDDTTGITYPVMDWHSDSPNAKINTTDSAIAIDSLYPAIFEKTIFDKIVSEAGCTYTFPSSVIGFENKVVPLVDRLSNAALMDAFEVNYATDTPIVLPDGLITTKNVTFEDLVTDSYGLMSGGLYFVIPIDGTYTAQFTFNYQTIRTFVGGLFTADFVIIHYDSVNTPKGEYRFQQTAEITETRSIFYTAKCNKGDKFFCQLVANGFVQLNFNSGSFKTQDIDCKYTGFGYLYPIAVNLPDITQAEFVKNIMQRYGLFVSQVENTLTFYKTDEILANKSKAVNLNDKVITNKRMFANKKFAIDGFAQSNYWKYKEDETVQGNFDGLLTCNNVNIDSEKTIYTSPFAACDDDIMCNGLQMAHVKRLVANVWTNKMLPKVLSTWQCTNTLDVSGSTVTLFNVAVFDDDVNSDSLHFQTVLDDNYNAIEAILTDPAEITVFVDWKVTDFVAIDPVIPYFLWNSYYLLKKIQNFNPEKPTELNLIKI